MLPLQRVWVQSLDEELRSHKLSGVATKKKTTTTKKTMENRKKERKKERKITPFSIYLSLYPINGFGGIFLGLWRPR